MAERRKLNLVKCPSCDENIKDNALCTHSGVSIDGAGFIHIAWGPEIRAQMSPTEAREYAHVLMAAAEAAETDALIFRFFQDLGTLEQGAQMMAAFRKYRDENQS